MADGDLLLDGIDLQKEHDKSIQFQTKFLECDQHRIFLCLTYVCTSYVCISIEKIKKRTK